MPEESPAHAVAKSLLTQARKHVEDGQLDAARRLWRAAGELAADQHLPGIRIQALHELAAFDIRDRDFVAARARLDEALELARASGEDAPVAAVAGRLGQVLVFQGEPHHGVVVMREAAAAWQRLGQSQPVRELELAIQAVCSRVDKGVRDAGTDSAARAQALFARARVRLASDDATGAQSDLLACWPSVQQAGDAESVAVVGTMLGQLMVAAQDPGAPSVLATTRAAWQTTGDNDRVAQIDALLASA